MAEPRTKPSKSVIDELKKDIRKPGENPYAKVCVYGRNGSGKTRFAASVDYCLIVDCNEEGDRSIKSRAKSVRVVPARTWERVGAIYWYLKSGKHPFKAVGIDTVTEMNALAMDFVLGEAEERDPTRERSQPDKRAYGRTGQLMRGMLYAYRNLPMHVIFTAQERRIRDQDTEELLEVTVDLPNASRGAAMGSVGVLGRLVPQKVKVRDPERDKVVRQWRDHLYLAPDEIVQTKDRTYSLTPILRDPTMPKIIKAWQANPPEEEA